MRPSLAIGAAVLLALGFAGTACTRHLRPGKRAPDGPGPHQAAAWHETQADEGFAFAMPQSPDVQRQNVKSAAGRLPLVMFIHESETAAFNVTVARYPEGFLAARAPEKILAGARDGAADRIGGELLEQRDLQLFSPDGRVAPGLEFVLSAPDETLYRGRIFVVEQQLIQLSYVSTRGAGSETDYHHFVESFILTPRADAVPSLSP